MGNSRIGADVKADVSVSAHRSQAFPLSLLGLSAISLFAGLYYLGTSPALSVIPFLLCLIFTGIGTALWWKSHRVSELRDSRHTEIVNEKTGLSVSTDSRTLESPQAVQNLATMLSQIAHRAPLPTPDGLVDESGNPIPDSRGRAIEVVSSANKEAQQIVQDFSSVIAKKNEQVAEQPLGNQSAGRDLNILNQPLCEELQSA